jgi:hypothetical protein
MSYLNVPISEPWVGGEVGMMTNYFFMWLKFLFYIYRQQKKMQRKLTMQGQMKQ